MRVGVVCEGPTDWHAIVCFLGTSLTARGIAPVFIDIQPETDRTNPPEGGWGAVLNWLRNNPPESRVDAYFDRGLFGGRLSAKRCDVMVFQMDADILSDRSFQQFAHIDKQPNRRRRYCEKHSAGFERLEAQCLHYRELVDSICGWSDSQ